MKRLLIALALLLFPLAVKAANCPGYSYILSNGQTADANQVMSNFNSILNCANTVLAPASALTGFAPINSPSFTGTPVSPTAITGDASSQIATDAFVQTAAVNATANRGLQSRGQLSITASTTLGPSQLGANILVSGAITLTFPSASGTYWLNNTGSSTVTLSFPTGTDFRNNLNPGEQVGLAGDGGGFWRIVAAGNPLFTATPPPGDNSFRIADTAFVANATPSATTSIQGLVYLATGVQALGGTNNANAVTGAGLASVQNLAATGYDQLPGGLYLQWGSTGSIGAGALIGIPLAHTCTVTPFSVVITAQGGGGAGGQSYAFVSGANTTSFNVTNNASTALNFYWQAICK